jgi:enoyl-CoA hydratase
MIHREDHEDVTVLRMEDGKVQALDLELVEALDAALEQVERGPGAAVVLTGTGSSFSAGVDLFRLLEHEGDYARRFLVALGSALRHLFCLPRPVVAAINGHAIAGGLVLACACDLRLAALGKGRLGVPELVVGLPFPALALEIVRFATPRAHVQELVYRGLRLTVEEALARGVVDEGVESEALLPRALERARELGALPPQAFALAKRQLRLPALELLDRHGGELDEEVLRQWRAPATQERIRAYLERTVGRSG